MTVPLFYGRRLNVRWRTNETLHMLCADSVNASNLIAQYVFTSQIQTNWRVLLRNQCHQFHNKNQPTPFIKNWQKKVICWSGRLHNIKKDEPGHLQSCFANYQWCRVSGSHAHICSLIFSMNCLHPDNGMWICAFMFTYCVTLVKSQQNVARMTGFWHTLTSSTMLTLHGSWHSTISPMHVSKDFTVND